MSRLFIELYLDEDVRVHFESLAKEYFASGKTHYGIIIAQRWPPAEFANRLLVILNNVTADEMTNQIRYI